MQNEQETKPKISCAYSELRDPQTLTPHPRNPNQHPQSQIQLLAKVIEHQGWRAPIIISARSGFVVAGHGRLSAALFAGMTSVPVDVQTFESEAEEWAHLVADNRLAELAELDKLTLSELLRDMQELDLDMELAGFDGDSLGEILKTEEAEPPAEKRSLAAEYGVVPFSVLDARSGAWQERKREWIDQGIASEEGREDLLAFSQSSQPPSVYARKNEIEAKLGRKMTWPEFAEKYPEELIQSGTSIFDPVVAELCLRWFCPAGGRVLDPFAGGSVRGLVAAKLGLHYTGVDLRPEQVDANHAQRESFAKTEGEARWICGDSRDLPKLVVESEFDAMLSCPPYFDLEVYSEDPADISNAGEYQDFLAAYREIISHACHKLAENAFACWIVGDVRDKNGNLRGLVGDTVRAFEDAGMNLYNDAILVTQAGSLPIRAGRTFEATRKLGKTHQYVLIFAKGDVRSLAKRCTLAVLPKADQGEEVCA